MWNSQDSMLREARSLVVDLEHREMILTPFRKFFNLGEVEELSYDKIKKYIDECDKNDFMVYEKLDGSMQSFRYIKEKDYCMLLCNERKDFTIFKNEISNHKDFTKTALSETISNRGLLLLADKQPNGAYELWIRDPVTNENFAYYLFDYTNGIVEVWHGE